MTGSPYEVVVVSYHSAHHIRRLVDEEDIAAQLIVVDHSPASEAEALEPFDRLDRVRVIPQSHNPGFAAGANRGFSASSAPFVVFLNPDASPTTTDLRRLVGFLESHHEYASCGPALTDATGAPRLGAGGWQPSVGRCISHALGLYNLLPRSGLWLKPRKQTMYDVEWVAGTCLAVRREAFDCVGGFDDSYFMYNEDMSLGLRFAGYGLHQAVLADTTVTHAQGTSSREDVRSDLLHRRASSLRQYILQHTRPSRARLMLTILALGYRLRSVVFTLLRQPERSREMRLYAGTLREQYDPPAVR